MRGGEGCGEPRRGGWRQGWRDRRRGGDPGGLMTHGCAAVCASLALAGGGDSGEVYAFNYSLPI